MEKRSSLKEQNWNSRGPRARGWGAILRLVLVQTRGRVLVLTDEGHVTHMNTPLTRSRAAAGTVSSCAGEERSSVPTQRWKRAAEKKELMMEDWWMVKAGLCPPSPLRLQTHSA